MVVQLGEGTAKGEGWASISLLSRRLSGMGLGCLNLQLGLVLMAKAPTLSLTRSKSESLGDRAASSCTEGEESLLLLSLSPFLLRSRGTESESVVGVSQELLSDSTDLECELLRFFSFRLLANTPSWGELRPILESRGRSEGRGSLALCGVVGEEQLEARARGENRPFHGSAVRGVPRVGVDSRPSLVLGMGVGSSRGVLIESKSRGDLRAARQPDISWNSRNFGVLMDSFGVERLSLFGDIRLPSLIAGIS